MKSINQIFANDEDLLDYKAVKELVNEYEALQEEHYDLQSTNKSLKDRDNLFLELLRDVQMSIQMEFKNEADNEKFNLGQEPTDYKAALENLRRYIQAFCKDNRIYL